jgi:hypothetical protein
VNKQRTSSETDPSIRPGTTRRTSRRPSKLVLLRVKVATIGMAVVLFFASLTGIAIYSPGASYEATAPVEAQQITIVKPGGSDTRVLAPPPGVTAVRPLARSRGS